MMVGACDLLEKVLRVSADCKEINKVHPEGYQMLECLAVGLQMLKTETPILLHPGMKEAGSLKRPQSRKDGERGGGD